MSSFINFAKLAEKEGYGEVVDAAEGFQLTFATGEHGATNPDVKTVSRRIQTWNKDRTELWQASPELYAANRREPYLGWQKFRPHILKGFGLYSRTAKPKKAARLVLQYINRIAFSNDEPPSEFVTFVPPNIQFADVFETFTCHTQQRFKGGDVISVATARTPESSSLTFDLNITFVKLMPSLDLKGLKEQIEQGHRRIIEAFEKTITDKQRSKMEQI
jgi:uncharacterized protein (TIGR04255 family)